VAIAEILVSVLPEHYRQPLLSKIEVSNLSIDTCISNLKTIRSVLQVYIAQEQLEGILSVSQFSPEGLFYREQDLSKFMSYVIVKIWEI
jgi:hypothetical protein